MKPVFTRLVFFFISTIKSPPIRGLFYLPLKLRENATKIDFLAEDNFIRIIDNAVIFIYNNVVQGSTALTE